MLSPTLTYLVAPVFFFLTVLPKAILICPLPPHLSFLQCIIKVHNTTEYQRFVYSLPFTCDKSASSYQTIITGNHSPFNWRGATYPLTLCSVKSSSESLLYSFPSLPGCISSTLPQNHNDKKVQKTYLCATFLRDIQSENKAPIYLHSIML